MRNKPVLLLFALTLLSYSVSGQKVDSLAKNLDSMAKEPDRARKRQELDINKTDYTARTNITPKSYFVLLATDVKQEVTGPFHAQKKTWIRAGEFVLIEGGLLFLDKAIQKNSQIFMTNNPNMKNVSQYVTDFGALYEVYTLAAFGAYGIIFKSNKVKTTTLLATQSYIAAGAMSWLVKFVVGRQRPNSFLPQNENNLVFSGPGFGSNNSFNSSFPSGHTTAAFAAATVFAEEYHDEILIPVIAYSAATLVGVSRITQNAHWATDVLAGAALGYITGKQVVFNYHRYARLQQGTPKKVTMYFNLQYNSGVIMPGLVCKF